MNSTYGVVKPSVVDINNDVEIWYHYRPTRNSIDTTFQDFRQIEEVSEILTHSKIEGTAADPRLPGMYNLSLPISKFGEKGFYTIYIKPKEYECTIKDVGALGAYPDVKGIIIDMNDVDNRSMFAEGSLTGYRVEYYEYNGGKVERQDYYRLITSNSMCEPVSQNLTSANTEANAYRYNASGTLCFITLTPSTSPSFKSNSLPYIGAPNQIIRIVNTKFDPVMIEVEMTEHDIETLSIISEGEVVRNLDNGRVTHYNFDGEIYKQFEFSTIKDNYTTNSVAEIKVDKSDNIDESLNLEELKNT